MEESPSQLWCNIPVLYIYMSLSAPESAAYNLSGSKWMHSAALGFKRHFSPNVMLYNDTSSRIGLNHPLLIWQSEHTVIDHNGYKGVASRTHNNLSGRFRPHTDSLSLAFATVTIIDAHIATIYIKTHCMQKKTQYHCVSMNENNKVRRAHPNHGRLCHTAAI